MEVKVLEIKPMFTGVITTMDMYKPEEQMIEGTNLIDGRKTKYTVKELQKVIAVGPQVRDIKVGDLVCINPSRFAKTVHKPGSLEECTVKDNPVIEYLFDMVDIDGKTYLYLQDRDINYIVTKYRPVVPKKVLKVPEPKIVLS